MNADRRQQVKRFGQNIASDVGLNTIGIVLKIESLRTLN